MNAVNPIALELAMAEYDDLPALPEGYDRRVTFARHRILPLTGEWPADLVAQEEESPEPQPVPTTAAEVATVPDDEPLYVRPKYQAPKLKNLEDILAMCERNKRNGTAQAATAAEGAGVR